MTGYTLETLKNVERLKAKQKALDEEALTPKRIYKTIR